MLFISSSEELKSVSIRGKWWIPGTSEAERVPGCLTFDAIEGGRLELDGFLTNKLGDIPVIHGLSTRGESITIFGGFSETAVFVSKLNGISESTIFFYDFWIGPKCFSDKAEVAFTQFSFGIHNLESWTSFPCFETKRDNDCLSIRATRPTPVPLYEKEMVSIRLESSLSEFGNKDGIWEEGIRNTTNVVIRAKQSPIPYYTEDTCLSTIEWVVFELVALLMGRQTWRFGCEGIIETKTSDSPGFHSFRHHRQFDIGKEKNAPITKECFLFSWEVMRPHFPSMIAREMELNRECGNSLSHLFHFQSSRSSFQPWSLPVLLFAFEKMEEFVFDKQNKVAIAAKKASNSRSGRKRPALTLFDRLKLASFEMQSVFPPLNDSTREAMCERLKECRNGFSHEATGIPLDAISRYRYCNDAHWLADLMTCMVLSYCGLSLDVIRDGISENNQREWRHLSEYFKFLNQRSVATMHTQPKP